MRVTNTSKGSYTKKSMCESVVGWYQCCQLCLFHFKNIFDERYTSENWSLTFHKNLWRMKKIVWSWQHCQMRYFDFVLSDVSWIRWLFNLIVSKYGCARFLKVLDTSFTKRTRRQIIVNLMRMKEIDSVHLMTWKLTEFWNEA